MNRDTIFNWLGVITILLFPFGQLTRIPLPFPGGALYLHDLTISLAVLASVPFFLKSNLMPKRYILGFFGFACFSLILSLTFLTPLEVLLSGLYLVRLLVYLLFLIRLYHMPKFHTQKTPYLLSVVIFFSLLFGFVQYFVFPVLEPIYAAGWDRHYYRLAGTWFDTGFTGILFVLFFLWSLDKVLRRNKVFLYSLLAVLAFAGTLLTYSRSSFLALAFAAGVYFLRIRNIFVPLILLVTMGVLIVFLPVRFGEGTKLLRTSTIAARLTSWQDAYELAVSRPLFGYGFNTLRYVRKHMGEIDEKWALSHSVSGVENSLLFILVTTGIVGLMQFGYAGFLLVKRFAAQPVIISSLAAVFVAGMFANVWFYPWVILWLGYLLSEVRYRE